MQTAVMFLAEGVFLFIYFGMYKFEKWRKKRVKKEKIDDDLIEGASSTTLGPLNGNNHQSNNLISSNTEVHSETPSNNNDEDKDSIRLREFNSNVIVNTIRLFPMFLLLAFCDLTGGTMATISLLYVPSSVYQLFRGTVVVFTGIFSIWILKRKLKINNWIGIGLVFFGLICVGLSGLLNNFFVEGGGDTTSSGAGYFVVGVVLLLVGDIIMSIQGILEEKYLKDVDLHPFVMVGFEGIFGFLMCLTVIFPIINSIKGTDCSMYENVFDGLVMMGQSGLITMWMVLQFITISLYNVLCLTIAKYLSAIHRTLFDAIRTIFVWGSMVIINWRAGDPYGEKIELFTWVELIGFVFVVLGMFIYNGVLSCKCCFKRKKKNVGDNLINEKLIEDNDRDG